MTAINNNSWTNPMEDYIVIKIDCSRNGFYSELHAWLGLHTTGKWATTSTRIGFEKAEDAAYFKLAWKG